MVAVWKYVQTKQIERPFNLVMKVARENVKVTSQVVSISTKVILARTVKGTLCIITNLLRAAIVNSQGTLVDILKNNLVLTLIIQYFIALINLTIIVLVFHSQMKIRKFGLIKGCP